jgi:hypothetical protein
MRPKQPEFRFEGAEEPQQPPSATPGSGLAPEPGLASRSGYATGPIPAPGAGIGTGTGMGLGPERRDNGPIIEPIPPGTTYGGRDRGTLATKTEDKKGQLEKFDKDGQPYNYFYVAVSGHIESGQFPFLDGINCTYNFVCGKDWHLADVFSFIISFRGQTRGHRSIRTRETMGTASE